MTDRQFLEWIHDRLEHVHGENPSVDYMVKLRAITDGAACSTGSGNRDRVVIVESWSGISIREFTAPDGVDPIAEAHKCASRASDKPDVVRVLVCAPIRELKRVRATSPNPKAQPRRGEEAS